MRSSMGMIRQCHDRRGCWHCAGCHSRLTSSTAAVPVLLRSNRSGWSLNPSYRAGEGPARAEFRQKRRALEREDTEGALVIPARCVVVRAESEDTRTSFRQFCGRGGDRPSGPGYPLRAAQNQSRDKSNDCTARPNDKHRCHTGFERAVKSIIRKKLDRPIAGECEHEIADRYSKQRH